MITVNDHGPVRELRLDRPPVNALSPELLSRLCDLVDAAPAALEKAQKTIRTNFERQAKKGNIAA